MSRSWVASWTDPGTGRRVFRRCRTKAERDALQWRMRDLARQVRQGLVHPRELTQHEARALPIAEVVDRWLADLAGRGTGEARRKDLRWAMLRLCEEARIARLGDLTAERVEAWLRGRDGLSARQWNRYAGAARQFGRWAAGRGGLLAFNPCEHVAGRSDASTVNPRRALQPDEVARLRQSPRWPDYALVLWTGLRWSEAMRLTWGSVDLTEGCIVVPAGVGKIRSQRAAVLPLSETVREALNDRRAVPSAPLLRQGRPALATWRRDLARCGVEERTADGLASRASWRPTFVSWLAAVGVQGDDMLRLRRDRGPLYEEVYVQRSVVLPRLRRAVERAEAWAERREAAG